MAGSGRICLRILATQSPFSTIGGPIHPATHDTMARVLRQSGDKTLSQQLLLAKHRALRHQQPRVRRISSWLVDITVGYGYRPLLALLWALGLYFLSVLLFWLAVHHNGIVATPLSGTTGKTPTPLASSGSYPPFSAWNYAVGSLLLPVVHFPGVDAWRANAVNNWGIMVQSIAWLDPVAFWALLLTLGATLTRLMTRDRD